MAKTIYSVAFRFNTGNEETNFLNTPLPLKRDGVLTFFLFLCFYLQKNIQ